MAKLHIVVAKRVSKTGNTYLSAGIKIGKYAKRDYFFININAVQELTGMSISQIEDAEVGVLCDKECEV